MKQNVRVIAAGILVFLMVVFTGLGIWQLQRLAWKNALLQNIERLQNAPYSPAPSMAEWDNLSPYQKLYVSGRWIADKDILVLAVTKYGRGYWLMTPLQTDAGFTILVNRGFVPDKSTAIDVQKNLKKDTVQIKGLSRESEPPRGFLQDNDPLRDRWYARNIEGIAKARELENVAPYFIDAEANDDPKAYPIGGLTVLQFRNNHLMYAITWFGLSMLCMACIVILIRHKP